MGLSGPAVPERWQNRRMAKSTASVRLDEELLKAAEALATRTGRKRDDVVEDALREFLTHPADILDRLRPQEELTDEQAMELALQEIEAYRSGR